MRTKPSNSAGLNSIAENTANYADLVNDAVRFSSLPVNFFTRAKALLLSDVVAAHFGKGRRVVALDVGCGIGLLHRELPQEQFVVTGVDVAEVILAAARSSNPSVEYQQYDGVLLPFGDGIFDVTFTVCVMHHLSPEVRNDYLKEMRRVTAKGGLICVIEHNPFNPLTRLAVMRCPFDKDANLLPAGEVKRRMSHIGLVSPTTLYFQFLPSLNMFSRKIEQHLAWLPLGAQYCICANT